MITVEEIIAYEVLESAYAWLCKRRKHYPPGADVWSFRRSWPQERVSFCAELLAGRYRMSLLSRVIRDEEEIDLWAARDALVLKALSLVLARRVPLAKECAHLKGHGGAKGAVRQVLSRLPRHRFVLRTDVEGYYASIDHQLMLDRLAAHIRDPRILNLVGQYLKRCAERGGLYWDYDRGLPLGCPLSPILGAFFLYELDERLKRLGLFFVRFMDDIVVLAPTRWKLRRGVKELNQMFSRLKLGKHPDKTFIGRIERGFDFLGYHFLPEGLSVAQTSVEHFLARALQLYEQEPGEPLASARLGAYVRRWLRWVDGGITAAE